MHTARSITISLALVLAMAVTAHAADPLAGNDIPEPALTMDGKGIWGAIAFSPDNGRRGIFWGADTRTEADSIALKHCERAGGTACTVVSSFRNHRHWPKDSPDHDGSAFPYEHCAALATDATAGQPAIGKQSVATTAFGAASATTGDQADAAALKQRGSASCKVVERVCT